MGLPDYTEGVILYAWNGTAFVPVLVDKAGNIVGVFKGQYGTVLKTVKVDEEGRLTAFMADPQDIWGNILPIGSGELASRLFSPKTYDKRGDVVAIDDFENGFAGWSEAPVGDVSDAILSAVTNRMGGYSLKLTAGTADEDEIIIGRSLQPLIAGKVGLEVSFSKDTPYSYIYIEMYLYDGAKIWHARVRYDSELHDLAYYNSTPDWTDIDTDVRLYEDINCFHTIKLVADFNTKKYERVLINQTEHKISTAGLYSDTATDLKHLAFGVTLEKNGAGTATSYLDSIILTQNEPKNVEEV